MSFDELTDEFGYTRKDESISSEVVSKLFYDENSEELVVVIHNESYWHEDYAYLYYGVSKAEAENFFNAPSKGTYYNTYIKRQKSSDHLGDWDDYEYVQIDVEQPAFAGTTAYPGYTSLRTVPQVQPQEGFTPKALYDNRTALRAVSVEEPKWTVNFKIGDDDRVRNYTVGAPNLHEAADAVLEIGEMMDADVVLIGVVLSD